MEEEDLRFAFGFLGDRARLLQSHHHAYIWRQFWGPFENGGETDYCTQQFSRGFWTLSGSKYAILKVKTNGKVLEVSIEMDRTLKGSKLLKGTN